MNVNAYLDHEDDPRAKLVFVAGPYTAPDWDGCLHNTIEAIRIGREIALRGHRPYIPHLTHYVASYEIRNVRAAARTTYGEWMLWHRPYLLMCEAMYLIAQSTGADMEIALADEIGLPIWRCLEDVPDLREGV